MDYSIIQNKSIALLVWNTEKENDAHVYLGHIVRAETGFDFFNEAKNWRVSLTEEQLARIEAVTEQTKDMFLEAEYFLSMSMVSLSDENVEELKRTGLQ